MTAIPPPAEPPQWTWRRTLGVSAIGAGGLIAFRAIVVFVAASLAPSAAFTDDATLTLEASTVRTSSYEILEEPATLSYRIEGATGLFTLYVLPEVEADAFLDGRSFLYLQGHAFPSVQEASGSVTLPKGTYAFAFVCEAEVSCWIPLHVEIGPAKRPAPLELASGDFDFYGPVALWDRAPLFLQPGDIVEEPEFYTTYPGSLVIEARSSQSLSVCLLTADEFEIWLDRGVRASARCESPSTLVQSTMEIVPGDYALLVECLAPYGERCRGDLTVLLMPADADEEGSPASAAA